MSKRKKKEPPAAEPEPEVGGFLCGKGCGRRVAGIYCPADRERAILERAARSEEVAKARAEAMKDYWIKRREQS